LVKLDINDLETLVKNLLKRVETLEPKKRVEKPEKKKK